MTATASKEEVPQPFEFLFKHLTEPSLATGYLNTLVAE